LVSAATTSTARATTATGMKTHESAEYWPITGPWRSRRQPASRAVQRSPRGHPSSCTPSGPVRACADWGLALWTGARSTGGVWLRSSCSRRPDRRGASPRPHARLLASDGRTGRV